MPQFVPLGDGPSGEHHWMLLRSGTYFNFEAPHLCDINIEDIAHALANLCRFNGHTTRFYSVAQHCVLVSQLCSPQYAIEGLLHDAAEAYLGDVTRGLKAMLPDYKRIEEHVESELAGRFNIGYPWHKVVHQADRLALAIERRDVMPPTSYRWQSITDIDVTAYPPIEPLEPAGARLLFMQRYRELTGYGY